MTERLTADELADIFGDEMPVLAVKIIFPEKSEPLTADEVRTVCALFAEREPRTLWQPIETAPEKGCFLVWQEKGGIGIACVGWHFGEKRFYDGDGLDSGNYVRWHPSHWMPLPKPPS